MRLLITGGSSYLGRHLVPLAARLPLDALAVTVYSGDVEADQVMRLDLRDAGAVETFVRAFRPNAIIHTAGSNRSDDMTTVIEAGARHLTRAAAAVDARLIHLSTDVIFDGTAAPYTESAAAAPIHAYGRAKAAAETMVRQWPHHVIVRTSLIYGLHEMDNGTRWMAQALQAGNPLLLFDNHWRNPVWAVSLSRALLELCDHAYCGVLNLVGDQAMTRAEFGRKLLDWWRIPGREHVTAGPDTSGRFPLDVRLDNTLAQRTLATPLPGVDDVLARRV